MRVRLRLDRMIVKGAWIELLMRSKRKINLPRTLFKSFLFTQTKPMNTRIVRITKRNVWHVLRTAHNRPVSLVMKAIVFALLLEHDKK